MHRRSTTDQRLRFFRIVLDPSGKTAVLCWHRRLRRRRSPGAASISPLCEPPSCPTTWRSRCAWSSPRNASPGHHARRLAASPERGRMNKLCRYLKHLLFEIAEPVMTSAASDALAATSWPQRFALPCHSASDSILSQVVALPAPGDADDRINGGLYGPPFIEAMADRGTLGRSQKQARSGGCTASPPARLPRRGFRHPREVI